MILVSTLYALIYLCLRGTLVIRGGLRLNLSPENVQGAFGRLSNDAEYRHFLATIGKSLLWFPFGAKRLVFPSRHLADIPLAYIVCFFPLLITGLIFVADPTKANSFIGLDGLAGAAASAIGK